MGRGKISSEKRASYKEIARNIVNADRAARRHGTSQNTIGSIERALVAAFLDGRKHDAEREAETEELTWIQVPPRSRETLCNMTFWFSTKVGNGENRADRIECFSENGTQRWSIVDADGKRRERSVADGSVRPLIRLGLIDQMPDNSDLYGLTTKGRQLCQDYWKRSDQDDPSLPKISLR